MAAAISVTQVIQGAMGTMVIFNITLTGSYVTGGDTLDFTKATQDASFQGSYSIPIESSLAPLQLDIWDQSGLAIGATSYYAAPVIGSTLANSKIKIAANGAFTEFSAGAYAAGLLAAKFTGSLVIARNL
jgi:hypothetical protein